LSILLNPSDKICSERPTNITQSSTYVIDVSKLNHPDDVKQDNFGIWAHSGSHTSHFKVHTDEDGYLSFEKCSHVSSEDVVTLRRLHSVHPSNKLFKRMIAFLYGKL
jgi:hypothetical protein